MQTKKLGIIQGRLTPSKGRGIQFFPAENWEKEFFLSRDLGLGSMEWVFDYAGYEENPIWNRSGCDRIRRAIDQSGIAVRTVCLDYFMRRPFYKRTSEPSVRDENLMILERVADHLAGIGGQIIEVPLVDDAAIRGEREREDAVKFLQDAADRIPQEVRIAVETDMPPGKFKQFLDDAGRENVVANYDLGDSAGRGYDPWEEICALGGYVENVHIKDKPLHGTTVELGYGAADFDRLFAALARIGYGKGITLQVARGQDGDEVPYIRKQMKFVLLYCEKYLTGGQKVATARSGGDK